MSSIKMNSLTSDVIKNDPMKVLKEDFIFHMKCMEKELFDDISNAKTFDRRYAYLLGCDQPYSGSGNYPWRKNSFDLKPDNAIHIIISNNIYSVWFESQRVIKSVYNIDLLDDFIAYYNSQTKDIEMVGCLCLGRKKRIYQKPLEFVSIVDSYILQFQLERDDGFYAIKKPISII